MREFILNNSSAVRDTKNYLDHLNVYKTKYIVIVKAYRKKRTLKQNSLLWKLYTVVGNELGYTKDEMHDTFREKFLPVETKSILGVDKKILTSTSAEEFTTKDMKDYIDQIYYFCVTDLGINLPHPDDGYWDSLESY